MKLYKTEKTALNLDRVCAIDIKCKEIMFFFGNGFSAETKFDSEEKAKKEYDSICNFLSKEEK